MVSDGHSLRQSWSDALNNALTSFRGHLTSGHTSWKRIPTPSRENSLQSQGKPRVPLQAEPDIVLHKKTTKTGDVYRAVIDISSTDDAITLDSLNAILLTPELRQEWDPAVESSHLLEMFDPSTRIVKTKFTLGWPAYPRDAVLITRTYSDASSTVINVSTSLPRSPDEPAYLRPSPPYVRTHVDLLGWCIQLIQPTQQPSTSAQSTRRSLEGPKLRLTCFWQHDLRSIWNLGAGFSVIYQVPAMVQGILTTVRKRSKTVAVLSGFGYGVSIEKFNFDIGRESLTLEYSIVAEDDHPSSHHREAMHGMDELQMVKEQRRLRRSVECILPTAEGWDVRITTRAASDTVAKLPWTANAIPTPSIQTSDGKLSTRVSFQVKHAAIADDHAVLKVKLVLEPSGGSKGIRLNGLPHPLEEHESRDPTSSMSNQLTQDASSAIGLSFNSAVSSVATVDSEASSSSSIRGMPPIIRTNSYQRTPAADKSVLARIRRNYIYFSSLLQEPEAKWKHNTETRGVSVSQLDSIDPTLVVYRAEATFVGVGLWDLYSAVVTPGARVYWDKQYEDATLLDQLNELSELWHYKTKPAWPTNGRDAVLLKTVYKSPTTVHVFAFSVDDLNLFANIPNTDPNIIRTQVDLQGWAIEALSPNTTLITLLEQSDPKGWSGKSTIPQQMISNVAGIGEFAIKCGGPPIMTRLSGAKSYINRYEHDRGSFRVEYVKSRPDPNLIADSVSPGSNLEGTGGSSSLDGPSAIQMRNSSGNDIECELRCDVDTWGTSLDIVIDPPPQSISALRRHRLSGGGGGLWMTIGHDAAFTDDDRLLVIVRRTPIAGKEKGVVMVNGKRISVDVEELPEAEVKQLAKQKRVKPVRVPLDQPPVLNAIRRRRAGSAPPEDDSLKKDYSTDTQTSARPGVSLKTSAPVVPSPLSNFLTMAYEQATSTTQQAVAAFTPPSSAPAVNTPGFSPTKPPMHYALDALSFAQAIQGGDYRDSWTLVTDKGLPIYRKIFPEVSPAFPVHKGEKVIEGVTADEVASAIGYYECRKGWDDRLDSAVVFEEYGTRCQTAFLVTKGGFPFRARGIYLASLVARDHTTSATTSALIPTGGTVGATAERSGARKGSTIYYASASFNPDSVAERFSGTKYNSYNYPIARVFLDVWVLETLDPYTSENYAIPSTRCTRLTSVDYAGSIPTAINSMINSAFPRSILSLEAYLKNLKPVPNVRVPASIISFAANENVEAGSSTDGVVWRMSKTDTNRTLVLSRYHVTTKVFNAAVSVSLAGRADAAAQAAVNLEERTSKPNQFRISSSLSRPASPEKTRLPDSLPNTPSGSLRHRRVSSVTPSSSTTHRSRSREPSSSLRTHPSMFALSSPGSIRDPMGLGMGHVAPPNGYGVNDFVVLELVVDTRLYPEGYEVRLASMRRVKSRRAVGVKDLVGLPAPSGRPKMKDLTSSDATIRPAAVAASSSRASLSVPQTGTERESNDTTNLPLTHHIYPIAPSPLYSSNLSANASDQGASRHLVRICLPTAQFEVEAIEDPLSGEVRHAPGKPEWYVELEGEDAVSSSALGSATGTGGEGKAGEKDALAEGEVKTKEDTNVNANGDQLQVASTTQFKTNVKKPKPKPPLRAIVSIEIHPLVGASPASAAALASAGLSPSTEGSGSRGRKKKVMNVLVDGVVVPVAYDALSSSSAKAGASASGPGVVVGTGASGSASGLGLPIASSSVASGLGLGADVDEAMESEVLVRVAKGSDDNVGVGVGGDRGDNGGVGDTSSATITPDLTAITSSTTIQASNSASPLPPPSIDRETNQSSSSSSPSSFSSSEPPLPKRFVTPLAVNEELLVERQEGLGAGEMSRSGSVGSGVGLGFVGSSGEGGGGDAEGDEGDGTKSQSPSRSTPVHSDSEDDSEGLDSDRPPTLLSSPWDEKAKTKARSSKSSKSRLRDTTEPSSSTSAGEAGNGGVWASLLDVGGWFGVRGSAGVAIGGGGGGKVVKERRRRNGGEVERKEEAAVAKTEGATVERTESQASTQSESSPLTPAHPSRTRARTRIQPQLQRTYTLPTLLFVALIAFLLGSLIRSLLSPADFIYVVNDVEEARGVGVLGSGFEIWGGGGGGGSGSGGGDGEGREEQDGGGVGVGGRRAVEPGWREIRRLVEVKYIVGGWDFQVAVVRRH